MRIQRLLTLAAAILVLVTACGGSDESASTDTGAAVTTGESTATSTAESSGLLGVVESTGTIRVSTDPAYPPQSFLNDQNNTYEGFDIDVATEVASRLGVEIAWETPSWDVLTAGNWNDRWDMSVGSMTPTNERQEVLYFTEPYYFTPAVVVVHADNTSVADLSTDLDGATIGVCSSCTYESYLNKDLNIEGFEFDFAIDDAQVQGYDTDTTALQDLALGDGARLDAVITSLTTAQGYIDEGNPVKIVGDPVFYEPLSVAFDKSAPEDAAGLRDRVDEVLAEMHADGTLTQMSEQWYDGVDLTVQQ